MIRYRITQIFAMLLVITLFTTIIVGIAWLFNAQPENLYKIWKFLGGCLAIAFVFQLLFGVKIDFK